MQGRIKCDKVTLTHVMKAERAIRGDVGKKTVQSKTDVKRAGTGEREGGGAVTTCHRDKWLRKQSLESSVKTWHYIRTSRKRSQYVCIVAGLRRNNSNISQWRIHDSSILEITSTSKVARGVQGHEPDLHTSILRCEGYKDCLATSNQVNEQ